MKADAKRPGEIAVFEGDEWFYVEHKRVNCRAPRRLWALFPVKAWADQWVKEMNRPEDFAVKQLRYPDSSPITPPTPMRTSTSERE